MKQFLGRSRADLEAKGVFGSGLLSQAVGGKHEPVVKPLLDRNVDANLKDQGFKAPSSYAAEIGAVAIAKLFLDCKEDPDSKDNRGRTTLSKAAANGAEAAVKLLLHCQIDADCKVIQGELTLSNAAK
ncbi:hypothetical protein MMC31_005712 [Peltigera leucophlebia]|nr:hypothetical protein [Peltigera leucophlebia]